MISVRSSAMLAVVAVASLCLAVASAQLPASFKWGSVGPILKQGPRCADCYSFSSARILQDRLNGAMPANVLLSPEHIASCSLNNGYVLSMDGRKYDVSNHGCNGGLAITSLHWLDVAVPSSSNSYITTCVGASNETVPCSDGCDPYKDFYDAGSELDQCLVNQCADGSQVEFRVTSTEPDCILFSAWRNNSAESFSTQSMKNVVGWSPSTEEEIRNEIFANGPVTAALVMFRDFKEFLHSTASMSQVWTAQHENYETYLGAHSVAIVGWNVTSDGVPYWIIANSWGTDTGADGFMLIERGINFLGIESHVCRAVPKLTINGKVVNTAEEYLSLTGNSGDERSERTAVSESSDFSETDGVPQDVTQSAHHDSSSYGVEKEEKKEEEALDERSVSESSYNGAHNVEESADHEEHSADREEDSALHDGDGSSLDDGVPDNTSPSEHDHSSYQVEHDKGISDEIRDGSGSASDYMGGDNSVEAEEKSAEREEKSAEEEGSGSAVQEGSGSVSNYMGGDNSVANEERDVRREEHNAEEEGSGSVSNYMGGDNSVANEEKDVRREERSAEEEGDGSGYTAVGDDDRDEEESKYYRLTLYPDGEGSGEGAAGADDKLPTSVDAGSGSETAEERSVMDEEADKNNEKEGEYSKGRASASESAYMDEVHKDGSQTGSGQVDGNNGKDVENSAEEEEKRIADEEKNLEDDGHKPESFRRHLLSTFTISPSENPSDAGPLLDTPGGWAVVVSSDPLVTHAYDWFSQDESNLATSSDASGASDVELNQAMLTPENARIVGARSRVVAGYQLEFTVEVESPSAGSRHQKTIQLHSGIERQSNELVNGVVNQQFTVTSASPWTQVSAGKDNNNKMGAGAIIGAVVGVIAGVAVVIAAAMAYKKREQLTSMVRQKRSAEMYGKSKHTLENRLMDDADVEMSEQV